MAEGKRVTLLNQGAGKVVLPHDPEELKKNPKAKHREVLAGQTIEVSEEEAAKFLRFRGLVDLSKMAKASDSSEVKKLKEQLADARAENEKLKAAAGNKEEAAELGDGDAVLTPAGDKGVIVKIKKKGMADVKLENGNISAFKLSDLQADPEAAAA